MNFSEICLGPVYELVMGQTPQSYPCTASGIANPSHHLGVKANGWTFCWNTILINSEICFNLHLSRHPRNGTPESGVEELVGRLM